MVKSKSSVVVEKSSSPQSEVEKAQEKLEQASSPLNAPTLQKSTNRRKHQGRRAVGPTYSKRILIFVTEEMYNKLDETGLAFCALGREALEEWLERRSEKK